MRPIRETNRLTAPANPVTEGCAEQLVPPAHAPGHRKVHMSAFIVSDDTINGIVSFLNRHARDYRWLFDGKYDLSQTEDLDKLGSDLYHMNCDAVDDRYGRGTAAGDTSEYPAFEFKFRRDMHRAAVYKAMCCLRYQCSEGNIPERPLFKLLEEAIAAVADGIVKSLPEYEAAQWG